MEEKKVVEEKKEKENYADIFKGLSVREEYGMYLYDDDDELEITPEHAAMLSKRLREQTKPSKHIAQGLHW